MAALFEPRLAAFGTSVFAEMTALAVRHDAVNLGQGFPDFDGPEELLDVAARALRSGQNQYCRSSGRLELARAVAEHQRRFYGLDYDPESEITIHSGATEALAAALLGLVQPGDEVVVFEPVYDAYLPVLTLAGAVPRRVALPAPHFTLAASDLERAISPRTRGLILNTPHNPTGRVFGPAELAAVAAAADRHDLWVVTDEVYEHIALSEDHVPLASLPGMRARTVVISSAGKTFSFTGWKVGWSCAPERFATAVRSAHQFLTFCTPAPFQLAAAHGLLADDQLFGRLRHEYRARRDRLTAGLGAAGFDVLRSQGTYFALADIRPLGETDGEAFCRALPERIGVAAIPVSAFCSEPGPVRHLVRFAFCKRDETLDLGLQRLRRLVA